MISKINLLRIYIEIKRSLKIAIPLIVSEGVVALSGFFATIMCVHLGQEILAAYALVWNAYLTSVMFFIGLFLSTSILIAHSFGARDHSSIKTCFWQGIFLVLFATPIMISIMWFCPLIFSWTNQSPVLIQLSIPASRSFIYVMLPLNIMFAIQSFFVGINRAYLVTIMSIIALPIEIFFFYVFLYGKLGFPKLGIAGIGYSLTITFSIIDLFCICYLWISKEYKQYKLFKDFLRVNTKILLELIQLGTPLGFLCLMEVLLFSAVAIMMGQLGVTTLAAYQISYQFLMIAIVIAFALIQSVTVRVGTEVGKNNRKLLRLATVVNIIIGLTLMMVFSIIYIYFPELVIKLIGINITIERIFSHKVLIEASKFLSIVGILILVECLRFIATGALRALKDIIIPTLIICSCILLLGIPFSYLFGFIFQFGGEGILWGIVIGLALASIILLYRFNRVSKSLDLKTLITEVNR